MRIRAPETGDRATLERFMAALQEHERALDTNRLPGAEMARDHIAALLDWVAGDPAAGCRLAEDGTGPAGFVLWGIEDAYGRFVLPENQRYGVISDLWVEPRARGAGLAGALIESAEAHLARHGVSRVEISALPGNAPALSVYRRLGYAPALVTLAKRIG